MYKEEFGEPYDYEDTPRFWAQQEMEKQIIENELEERMKNES